MPEDGKNLNRVFPGNPEGTLSEKTAGLISSSFFPLADFYVDLHSGDIHESLHPYVYYPGQPTEELAAKARSVAKVLNVNIWCVQWQQAALTTTLLPPACLRF